MGWSEWLKATLAEGQFKEEVKEPEIPTWFNQTSFYRKFILQRPRWVAVGLPVLLVWGTWFPVFFAFDLWYLFEGRWFMVVTMLFASIIGGGTSEGGGSVSYPVMTLFFKIRPPVARDMSLITQSFGMGGATFTHMYQRIKYEQTTLLFATIGGCAGTMFGINWVSPYVEPHAAKIAFVSVWLGFAASLFCLNFFVHDRVVHLEIPFVTSWKICIILAFSFVGGILTAVFGVGLDICIFSMLTLLFRVSEKTATPTTVMLQAFNCIFAVCFKYAFEDGINIEALDYAAVCIEIVVVGAPFGAFFSSFLHRSVLSTFIYVADVSQYIAALIIVPMTGALYGMSAGILAGSVVGFVVLTRAGGLLLESEKEKLDQQQLTSAAFDKSRRYKSFSREEDDGADDLGLDVPPSKYDDFSRSTADDYDADMDPHTGQYYSHVPGATSLRAGGNQATYGSSGGHSTSAYNAFMNRNQA